jgi:outer membrane protein
VVSAGWFHIQTFGTSGPLTTNVVDVPINYPLGLPSSFSRRAAACRRRIRTRSA